MRGTQTRFSRKYVSKKGSNRRPTTAAGMTEARRSQARRRLGSSPSRRSRSEAHQARMSTSRSAQK
jgi:hypothetical protein